MKILELFSGSGIMSQTFREHGHQTLTLDSDKEADINEDILNINPDIFFPIDIIWASPPCTTFSVASIGHHWYPNREPKTEEAKNAIKIIRKTIQIIKETKPKYWFIENPVGMLRTLHLFKDLKPLRRITVTYCQYGDTRRKPTDIWTNCPTWHPRKMCNNGDKCHIASPRGSKTGTQGLKGSYERSTYPKELCLEILKSCI